MGEKKNKTHTALYRKYRSKSLSDIIGQDHITKTLGNALKSGKINHAYLFTGPRGTGKTSVARILAHQINDLPYTDESIHLDIIEIDAASNRRIDDIRELRDKVHSAPSSAKYKVYIIDEVHMLTNESFNALLKTLEEPPAHVIFILATTEVHKLPATITSRAQRHSFKLIPQDQVVEHLAKIAELESIEIDKPALEVIAKKGGGSFRDSISILDQISGGGGKIDINQVELLLGMVAQNDLNKLLDDVKKGDLKAIILNLSQLLESGITPVALSEQLIELIKTEIGSNGSQNLVLLMNELLNVQGSLYQQLKLETTLLSSAVAINPEATQVVSSQPETPKPSIKAESVTQPRQTQSIKAAEKPIYEKKPKAKLIDKKEQQVTEDVISSKPESTQMTKNNPSTEDVVEKWPEFLKLMKVKNNSVYTVLRLCKPEVKGSNLILNLKFPFHQKRIDDLKHKILIAEVLNSIFETELEIVTTINKDLETISYEVNSEPHDPAYASHIAAVQDIMGGGEVVNV